LDENQEKLSKQTMATSIQTDSSGNALKALRGAGLHLGLSDSMLFNQNDLSVAKWLERAIQNYKGMINSR
jgi:glutamyl-Q tRNA(Asp) synthetase